MRRFLLILTMFLAVPAIEAYSQQDQLPPGRQPGEQADSAQSHPPRFSSFPTSRWERTGANLRFAGVAPTSERLGPLPRWN